jgi:hypothetical protein
VKVTTADPRLFELLRAMAEQRWDRAADIAEQLDDAEWPGGDIVVGAAFVLTLDRYFGPRPSRTDMALLAAEAVNGVTDTPHVVDVFRLIRAALGEPDLVAQTNPDTRLPAQLLVLGLLLGRDPLMGEAVEEFIGHVVLAVAGRRR